MVKRRIQETCSRNLSKMCVLNSRFYKRFQVQRDGLRLGTYQGIAYLQCCDTIADKHCMHTFFVSGVATILTAKHVGFAKYTHNLTNTINLRS